MKDRLKISIQDASGNYYFADKQDDNTYVVDSQVDLRYIDHLPIGWASGTRLRWTRNMTYYGVFRGEAQSMQFVQDGRAILLDFMYGNGGMNAYALITVYKFNSETFNYDLFFSAQGDFSASPDNKQTTIFTLPLLESKAVELLKAKSNSSINIPFWTFDGANWNPRSGLKTLFHPGIKLYWEGNFRGAETAAAPFGYTIQGFNRGEHGTASHEGRHTLPSMDNFIKVRNNGTVTQIGNDVLEKYTVMYQQPGTYQEVNFLDPSAAPDNKYLNQKYLFKTLLSGQEMVFTISGKFESTITFDPAPGGEDLKFVLFELDATGEPPQTTPGQYDVFAVLYSISLGATSPYTPASAGVFSSSNLLSINEGKAYVLGIIFDGTLVAVDSSNTCQIILSNLELTIKSNYNSGTSTPITAPTLPGNRIVFMRPIDIWKALINGIDSVSTDIYGFPAIVGGYSGTSTYLSTVIDPADNFGMAPTLLAYTSENAMKNIKGIEYITTSLADFFNTHFRLDGCGLGISDNNFFIEKLSTFFDASTEILSLGDKVSGFTVSPMSDITFNNIKAGFKAPATNSNFAVDEYIIPAEYNLPLNKNPKMEDLSVTNAVVGMYEIEKMRAQINTSEISNPSTANGAVILQLLPGEISPSTRSVLDPAGVVHTLDNAKLYTFPTAQSTDPTAATDPYISGLYYPDTALNVGLLPPLNLYRNSPLLHSLCDQLDSSNLTYRRQYQMNFSNPLAPLELPGISINLYGDGVVSAVGDIPVSSFEPQLFRPYLLHVTAAYDESMFALINANPYGYISFLWSGSLYKGFVYSVEQSAGNSEPTAFELIAHPDTTDAQLKA